MADECLSPETLAALEHIRRERESKHKRSGPDEAQKPPPLPFIKIRDWQDQPVPERPWIIKDRIPAGNVTLLSGEGSIGKSILSLQLSVVSCSARSGLDHFPIVPR
jgi:hypothetical protein